MRVILLSMTVAHATEVSPQQRTQAIFLVRYYNIYSVPYNFIYKKTFDRPIH